MNALFADPRRRTLTILGALAIVGLLLAVIALHEQAEEVAPKYTPHEFFPGLAAEIQQAARIHIVSKDKGAFDVVFKPSIGWVLPQKGDYPASFAEVNKTLVGLAALETIEPKTSRADWLHDIDLDAPQHGGAGTEITVSNDKGKVLSALIIGRSEDIGDQGGATGLFVRQPDTDQSWLVRAEFQPANDPADWIEKTLLNIDASRIQEADVDPLDGPSFEVRREKPGDTDFAIVNIPKGREPASEGSGDSVAQAITGFSFTDVKPARDLDFSKSARVVTKTFNGLTVTVSIIHPGTDYWAQVSAEAPYDNAKLSKEARQIDVRTAGWAYKLPDYKGAQFATTLESLLKPKPGK